MIELKRLNDLLWDLFTRFLEPRDGRGDGASRWSTAYFKILFAQNKLTSIDVERKNASFSKILFSIDVLRS